MTANYLGRYSDHLWAEVGLNPGVFLGLGPCAINGVSFTVCSTNANLNQRRKFSLENPRQAGALGFVDQHNAVGWQTYQGLRLTVTRRAATGLSISGNYTLSRVRGHGHAGELRADRQRLHESRRSGHGQGTLRPGPDTPGECDGGLHDPGVRQSGAEHRWPRTGGCRASSAMRSGAVAQHHHRRSTTR